MIGFIRVVGATFTAAAVCAWMGATPAQAQFSESIELGKDAFSFHGRTSGTMRAFASDSQAEGAVKSIMDAIGLPLRFEIKAAAVPNASAILTKDGRRLIAYNVNFMEDLRTATGEDWSAVSVMAHEIGHHLSFHLSHDIGDHDAELEADFFSGFVLAKMGATREQALAAMRDLGEETASNSHPAKIDRLQAIGLGWKNASLLTRPNLGQLRQANEETKTSGSPLEPLRGRNIWVSITDDQRRNEICRRLSEGGMNVDCDPDKGEPIARTLHLDCESLPTGAGRMVNEYLGQFGYEPYDIVDSIADGPSYCDTVLEMTIFDYEDYGGTRTSDLESDTGSLAALAGRNIWVDIRNERRREDVCRILREGGMNVDCEPSADDTPVSSSIDIDCHTLPENAGELVNAYLGRFGYPPYPVVDSIDDGPSYCDTVLEMTIFDYEDYESRAPTRTSSDNPLAALAGRNIWVDIRNERRREDVCRILREGGMNVDCEPSADDTPVSSSIDIDCHTLPKNAGELVNAYLGRFGYPPYPVVDSIDDGPSYCDSVLEMTIFDYEDYDSRAPNRSSAPRNELAVLAGRNIWVNIRDDTRRGLVCRLLDEAGMNVDCEPGTTAIDSSIDLDCETLPDDAGHRVNQFLGRHGLRTYEVIDSRNDGPSYCDSVLEMTIFDWE